MTMATKQEVAVASPVPNLRQQQQRRVTMDVNAIATTPSARNAAAMMIPQSGSSSIANATKSALPVPEPSPNKSAAAFALSLLCTQQTQAPPSATATTTTTTTTPHSAQPPVAFPPPPHVHKPMPHPTPSSASYGPPPQAWQQQQQQFRPFPGNPNETPVPVKRLKVSHASLAKQNATPHHVPQGQYVVPSPYAPYPPQQGMTSSSYPVCGKQPTANGSMPPTATPTAYGQPPAPFAVPPGAHYPSPSMSFPPPPQHMVVMMNGAAAAPPLASSTGTSMVTPTPSKKQANYSRKNKSLGLLCENFISTYSKNPSIPISIDNAATALGVERRRIYDIINIFESIEIVQRKCKNTYEWLGTSHLVQVFGKFQQEALVDFPHDAAAHGLLDGEDQREQAPQDTTSNKNQKKSLGKLSQQFLQLFLVGHQVLSLTDASDKILGASTPTEVAALAPTTPIESSNDDPKDMQAAATRGFKTKIRRLYDISNVFCALGICKKIGGDLRKSKPKFQWAFSLSAKQVREQHLKAPAVVTTTTRPVVLAPSGMPIAAPAIQPTGTLSTTTTPATVAVTAVVVTQEEEEQRDDGDTTTKSEESVAFVATSSGTPVCCGDKKLMANINVMGAAQTETGSSPESTELLRTVSLTTDV